MSKKLKKRISKHATKKVNRFVRVMHLQSLVEDSNMQALRKAGHTDLPCKEGCHYCCYEPTEAIMWEAKLAAHHVRHELHAEQRKLLEQIIMDWVDWYMGIGRPMDPREYRANPRLCPFCIGEKCVIYDYRPMACRIHVVPDGPECCKPERAPDDDGTIVRSVELITSAWIATGADEVYTFPEAVASSLGLLPKRRKLVVRDSVKRAIYDITQLSTEEPMYKRYQKLILEFSQVWHAKY